MTSEEKNIPIKIVQLLIGYFTGTNTEADKDALDEWVCINDENMKVFEECLEISLRPIRPDPDNDELAYFANLITKHFSKTITEAEEKILNDWMKSSDFNKNLFREIPHHGDKELLYHWLLERLDNQQDKIKLN